MKKILFILLFVFGFNSVYAIDERIIDFYFGNGVWNTRDDARISKDALRDFISDNLNISTTYTIELSYNWSKAS
jgi:hypothetical protein